MKITEIKEIFKNPGTAFYVIIEPGESFLAHGVEISDETAIFLVAEKGKKQVSLNNVKKIELLNVQELLNKICFLNKRYLNLRARVRCI